MLDELVSPSANSCDVFADLLKHLGPRWIENRPIARQPPRIRGGSMRQQGSNPDAGPRPNPRDFRRQARHIRKLLVSAFRLPPIVDHGERPIPIRWSQIDDVFGVDENGGFAVTSVRPVPVIAAVDRLRWDSWIPAQLPAECVQRGER